MSRPFRWAEVEGRVGAFLAEGNYLYAEDSHGPDGAGIIERKVLRRDVLRVTDKTFTLGLPEEVVWHDHVPPARPLGWTESRISREDARRGPRRYNKSSLYEGRLFEGVRSWCADMPKIEQLIKLVPLEQIRLKMIEREVDHYRRLTARNSELWPEDEGYYAKMCEKADNHIEAVCRLRLLAYGGMMC